MIEAAIRISRDPIQDIEKIRTSGISIFRIKYSWDVVKLRLIYREPMLRNNIKNAVVIRLLSIFLLMRLRIPS